MKAGTDDWIEAEVEMSLEVGDSIKTGDDSSAEITFVDGSTIEVQAGTEIEVGSLATTDTGSATVVVKQTIGSIIFRVTRIVDPASRYEVETPAGVVAVRGSIVQVYVTEDGTTRATNLEGDIWAVAQGVELQIPEGLQCVINPGQPPELEIRDWYDLDAVRDNLAGSYLLMNDIDSTTVGYEELASPTANGGQGWDPIGSVFADEPFTGSMDGQGYEIRDLFISRPSQDGVGLFGYVYGAGDIKNLGVVSTEVSGRGDVGGLVGHNHWGGTVADCYSTGSVTGSLSVGGLVGTNDGATVSNSYSSVGVAGVGHVGGLVGWNGGTVNDSYSSGSVTGSMGYVGGLVGRNNNTVKNSHYSYDEVLINGRNTVTIGALYSEDFEQWLANDKSLDVDERLSQEDGYYVIDDVSDFKQLLAFGQDGSLRFKLENDLDLGGEPDFYIPYLGGDFDGNGHKISNLRLNRGDITQVGLFGYLGFSAAVTELGAENVDVTGDGAVGGLVGDNNGMVSNSYSSGSVNGNWGVGGVVGRQHLGDDQNSAVKNSHYSYDELLINGRNTVTIGALYSEDFEQWLANDKSLDVDERLSREDGYYVIDDVSDFKQLLAFGQDSSLKFRLNNDIDLATEPNFYIPYLSGEFDGNGHKISNLRLNFDDIYELGLFGHLASSGVVTGLGAEDVSITSGVRYVGGLVGGSFGSVSNSYSTGSVTGSCEVGGLVGWNKFFVRYSYSSCSVTGEWAVGGLVGWHYGGTVINSYSVGSVTGEDKVGGLVGFRFGAVNDSFWDIETSRQTTSDGGTGKTTAEMKDIMTFTGAGWDITSVTSGVTDPAHIWNIVDSQTYPFLSWEPVS